MMECRFQGTQVWAKRTITGPYDFQGTTRTERFAGALKRSMGSSGQFAEHADLPDLDGETEGLKKAGHRKAMRRAPHDQREGNAQGAAAFGREQKRQMPRAATKRRRVRTNEPCEKLVARRRRRSTPRGRSTKNARKNSNLSGANRDAARSEGRAREAEREKLREAVRRARDQMRSFSLDLCRCSKLLALLSCRANASMPVQACCPNNPLWLQVASSGWPNRRRTLSTFVTDDGSRRFTRPSLLLEPSKPTVWRQTRKRGARRFAVESRVVRDHERRASKQRIHCGAIDTSTRHHVVGDTCRSDHIGRNRATGVAHLIERTGRGRKRAVRGIVEGEHRPFNDLICRRIEACRLYIHDHPAAHRLFNGGQRGVFQTHPAEDPILATAFERFRKLLEALEGGCLRPHVKAFPASSDG